MLWLGCQAKNILMVCPLSEHPSTLLTSSSISLSPRSSLSSLDSWDKDSGRDFNRFSRSSKDCRQVRLQHTITSDHHNLKETPPSLLVLPNQCSVEPSTENHLESQKKSCNKQVKIFKYYKQFQTSHEISGEFLSSNWKYLCVLPTTSCFVPVKSYLKLHSVALSLCLLTLLKTLLTGSDKNLPTISFCWPVNFLYAKETLPMKVEFLL